MLKKWNNLSIRIFLTWFPSLKAVKWLTVNRYSRWNWVPMAKLNAIKLASLQKGSFKLKALTSMRRTHLLLVILQSRLYLLSHAQIAGTSTRWMWNQPSWMEIWRRRYIWRFLQDRIGLRDMSGSSERPSMALSRHRENGTLRYTCYELRSLGLDNRTTLILSNTRELDRVPKTK